MTSRSDGPRSLPGLDPGVVANYGWPQKTAPARGRRNRQRLAGRDYFTLTSLTSNTTAWPGPTGDCGPLP